MIEVPLTVTDPHRSIAACDNCNTFSAVIIHCDESGKQRVMTIALADGEEPPGGVMTRVLLSCDRGETWAETPVDLSNTHPAVSSTRAGDLVKINDRIYEVRVIDGALVWEPVKGGGC
jgi:hypothetical protein